MIKSQFKILRYQPLTLTTKISLQEIRAKRLKKLSWLVAMKLQLVIPKDLILSSKTMQKLSLKLTKLLLIKILYKATPSAEILVKGISDTFRCNTNYFNRVKRISNSTIFSRTKIIILSQSISTQSLLLITLLILLSEPRLLTRDLGLRFWKAKISNLCLISTTISFLNSQVLLRQLLQLIRTTTLDQSPSWISLKRAISKNFWHSKPSWRKKEWSSANFLVNFWLKLKIWEGKRSPFKFS